MIILRPYQIDMIDRTREAMKIHRRVLLQAPTGSGKTSTTSSILHNVAQKGKLGGFFCHRVELIDQTINTFNDFGIPHGVIAAGYSPNPYQPIQVCSIDTLKARIRKGSPLPNFDIIVIDEAAHCGAAGWMKVLAHWPKAYHLGITATPARTDGKGLSEHFDTMVLGPSVAWLIENGYLAPYKAYAPAMIDTSTLHTKMGDYDQAEAEKLMDQPSITGCAIAEYTKLAEGKRAIVFCLSIRHSQSVVAQFQAAGIAALHIDGTTPSEERRRAIRLFKEGRIKVLSNVNLFVEGLDCPAAEVCILLRPTQSLSLYLQAVGRVLRPMEGKTAILLDHASNILFKSGKMNHGFPDTERTWTLEGRAPGRKKDKDQETKEEIRQCPSCYHCHEPAPKCPGCGHVYQIKGRTLRHVDGELSEVSARSIRESAPKRKMTKKEWANGLHACKTLPELIAFGRECGYKNPSLWATKELQDRKERETAVGRRFAGK